MANSWIEALKKWNTEKGGAWCVPRKGSKEYDEVKRYMSGSTKKKRPVVPEDIKEKFREENEREKMGKEDKDAPVPAPEKPKTKPKNPRNKYPIAYYNVVEWVWTFLLDKNERAGKIFITEKEIRDFKKKSEFNLQDAKVPQDIIDYVFDYIIYHLEVVEIKGKKYSIVKKSVISRLLDNLKDPKKQTFYI